VDSGMFRDLPGETLPGAGFIIVTVAVLETALKLRGRLGPDSALLALPALHPGARTCRVSNLSTRCWNFLPRRRVWRRCRVPLSSRGISGFPGARIGRRVYIDSTRFREFDLTEIGDRSILDRDCILQTRFFEGRMLKASRLLIGGECQIGTHSIVLYDAEVKNKARLGPLSLLMKGEVLPAGKTRTRSPLGISEPCRLVRSNIPPCKKG
jgi:acetyltransferase-like isoleucine patch superfamily enzyme